MTDTNRIGDWCTTYSDTRFYPLDPRPEEIKLEDIAHALSLICRFGGHTKFHYSVAQHSVLVATILASDLGFAQNRNVLLQGLMHDAQEAYIGDMVRPLKAGIPEYEIVEARVWEAVCEAFGIPKLMLAVVKEADNIALLTEKRDVCPATKHHWEVQDYFKPSDNHIIAQLTPAEAEQMFLETFQSINRI